jgi:hypothetical protein
MTGVQAVVEVIVAVACLYGWLGEYKVYLACPVCSCGRRHSITSVQANSEAEACELARQRHLREVHGCEE